MIVVIPLGGVGIRFLELGYKDPKPFIKVLGKEIIFWVLDNLKLSKKDKLYIVYNNQLDEFNFTDHFRKYPEVNFLKLKFSTRGPVETIYELTKIIEKNNNKKGVLILDGDTFYKKDIIRSIKKNYNTIFFHRTKIKEPIFSYIKLKKNKVSQIAEKIKISNNANTGAYYFNSLIKFNFFAKETLKKNKKSYVSDVYKEMLKNKIKIVANFVRNSEFVCLGTPKQVIDFCKNIKIQKKRFCFDLDNTLVTFPYIKGDYTTVKPIEKNIKFLNYLKSIGHFIIIYTARRMRTHDGNIKKVKKEIEKLTKKQLKIFNIKYDKLIFGKPYAHYYIDDLAINPYENLNIKLGYYEKKEDLTRKFNEVVVGEIFTIKKSKNIKILKNEINYLKSIPNNIKNFFPKFISQGKNWYKMQTINGLKLSYLLVNNLLTREDIKILFEKLSQIHSSKKFNINNNYKINFYENYSKKLNERIKGNKKILNTFGLEKLKKLDFFLKNYEKTKKGKIGVIHGDAVMSNIIKKENKDLVFLDPRGSIRNKFTIYGDVNYDFAKIYQSLTGYENIILEKLIDEKYLKYLREYYENLLIEKKKIINFSTLKNITSSLYLSLISFHDDKYHVKFLEKASKLI